MTDFANRPCCFGSTTGTFPNKERVKFFIWAVVFLKSLLSVSTHFILFVISTTELSIRFAKFDNLSLILITSLILSNANVPVVFKLFNALLTVLDTISAIEVNCFLKLYKSFCNTANIDI